MPEMEEKVFENNFENAKEFLNKENVRKTPNNRISGLHFFEIVNKGASVLIEMLLKE